MKKVLASILMASFLFSVALTGCGSKAVQSEETATTSSTVSVESSTAAVSEVSHEPVTLKYTGWGSPNEKKVTQMPLMDL